MLHLWDYVEADLIDLGIKCLDPSIFAAADFKHVSTSQLQHSLLKVALLLGVRVRFGCSVDDIRSLRSHLDDVATTGADAATRAPLAPAAANSNTRAAARKPASTGAPTAAKAPLPDVLVDATGARCPLFESLGFAQGTVLRSARALCIVLHLRNGKTADENRLQESTWSSQYHQDKFAGGKAGAGTHTPPPRCTGPCCPHEGCHVSMRRSYL